MTKDTSHTLHPTVLSQIRSSLSVLCFGFGIGLLGSFIGLIESRDEEIFMVFAVSMIVLLIGTFNVRSAISSQIKAVSQAAAPVALQPAGRSAGNIIALLFIGLIGLGSFIDGSMIIALLCGGLFALIFIWGKKHPAMQAVVQQAQETPIETGQEEITQEQPKNIYAEQEAAWGKKPATKEAAPSMQATKPATPAKPVIDWEEWVGQKLLQKLGIGIFIVGILVLLKYSFDNNIVGPHGRIALAALAGVAFLGAGEFFQKKYPAWFQGFTGGGLFMLYLAVTAMHWFTEIFAAEPVIVVGPVLVSALYILITALGALASIRYKAQTLAWFTFTGGYLTPLLVRGVDDPIQLVVYLCILAAGVLSIAWFQRWRYLNIGALVATQLYLFGSIYDAPYTLVTDVQQLVIAAGFFALFGILPFLYHFRLQAKATVDDVIMTLANGAAVLLPAVDAVGGIDSQYTSIVCLALAAIYMAYSALTLQRRQDDVTLVNTYITSSISLIAMALLAELKLEWVAVGWAPLSVLILYMSSKLKRGGPWRSALVLLAASLLALIFNLPGSQLTADQSVWAPFTSEWSIKSYVVFASLLCWIGLAPKIPSTLLPDQQRTHAEHILHGILAVLLFGILTLNALAFGGAGIHWHIDITLAMFTLVFSAVALGAFVMTRSMVWFGAAFIGHILVLMYTFILGGDSGMVYGSSVAKPFFHPWAAISVLAMGMSVVMGIIAQRQTQQLQTPKTKFYILAVCLAQLFVHMSIEIKHISDALTLTDLESMRLLTGWWTVFGVGLLGVGSLRNWRQMVQAGTGLLFLPLLTNALYILSNEPHMYETALWTVLPLGITALAADRKDYVLVRSSIVYCIIFLGTEMLRFLSSSSISFIHVAWWAATAFGALSIGFRYKAGDARKLGICLFLAIAANMLLFYLGQYWHQPGVLIAIFLVTGLIMIGGSYLYQRFSAAESSSS